MSDLLNAAIGAVGGLAERFAGDLVSAIIGTPRAIGTFIPNVVIREMHEDRWTTTRHPVEFGSPIADHRYREPEAVAIDIGWSDAGLNLLSARGAYARLLQLADSREPFFILTGKRIYRNMVVDGITTTTDNKTEHALIATVMCSQVRIVYATTVSYPGADAQANPALSSATQEVGQRQPLPVPQRESLLSQAGGFLGFVGGGTP